MSWDGATGVTCWWISGVSCALVCPALASADCAIQGCNYGTGEESQEDSIEYLLC